MKVLVPEEGSEAAALLFKHAIGTGSRLIAPSFAWAEVGTVLRKKVKSGLLTEAESGDIWDLFMHIDIEYVDGMDMRQSAWELASLCGLPTLYDAAFVSACELAKKGTTMGVQFWTADRKLVADLGLRKPEYVRLI